MSTTAAAVSLRRWLRRQLREPAPERERLEAAIAHDDPAEARRLVGRMPFTESQRRHVERLLDEWERGASTPLSSPSPKVKPIAEAKGPGEERRPCRD